jgi:hypothetical protein
MSRGKARPDTFVTIARGKKPLIAVTTIAATPPPSRFGSEEDKRRLAAKLHAGHPLTTEERSFLARQLEPNRKRGRPPETNARAQSLHVAQYLIYLRAVRRNEKHDNIDGMVAKTFGCSVRTVRADVAYAKRFDGGAWWRRAEQDPTLPTSWQFRLE